MPVFRVEKNKGYTVMSNYHLRDKTLSLKAKGLLLQILSLPEDWDYALPGLCYINWENKDAMANKLDHIEKVIQRVKSKIAQYNKRFRELEGQKIEQENLQIIQLVRGMNMTREEFAAFLRAWPCRPLPF